MSERRQGMSEHPERRTVPWSEAGAAMVARLVKPDDGTVLDWLRAGSREFIGGLVCAIEDEVAPRSSPPADRADLWAMWTAGEKLAYGCGYRDGKAFVPEDRVDACLWSDAFMVLTRLNGSEAEAHARALLRANERVSEPWRPR